MTFTAWNSRGQPTSMTDPNGTVVAFEYDGMGRLKKVSRDVGNTPLVWSIAYDVICNVTRIDEPSGSFRLYA